MFKLFKKSANNDVVVAEPKANLKGKTVNEIIDEIHDNFYSEVDKLLASAKISNSLDTDKQELIDKCARLKLLGFTNTKEVKEAEAEIARLEALKVENEEKKTIIEAINYFSFKYPNYKFITEDSVKKICAKYNLVYGEISKYIGTVPDKNLNHIENFKINEVDECWTNEKIFRGFLGRDVEIRYFSGSVIVQKKLEKEAEEKRINEMSGDDKFFILRHQMESSYNINTYYTTEEYISPLEIAAPLKDFNMTNEEVKDFKISKIEIPDPVVLKPVFFGGKKHYLIVTAWGQEASDELVVNQKFN